MKEILITIVIVVIVCCIALWLFKSFAKFIILLGVIYILFSIGFLWTSEDFSKLQLEKFFNPDTSSKITNAYEDFTQKRDEMGVMNTEAIRSMIDSAIESAVTKAGDEVSKIDTQKLMEDINLALQGMDEETVTEAINYLKTKLDNYNISEEELITIINQQNAGATEGSEVIVTP